MKSILIRNSTSKWRSVILDFTVIDIGIESKVTDTDSL